MLATETGERCFTSPMITLVRRVLYYFTYLLSVSSPGLTSIEHECLVDRGSYYKRIFTTNKSNTNVKSLNLERLGLEQRKSKCKILIMHKEFYSNLNLKIQHNNNML